MKNKLFPLLLFVALASVIAIAVQKNTEQSSAIDEFSNEKKEESAKNIKKEEKHYSELSKFTDKEAKGRVSPDMIARVPNVTGSEAKQVSEVLLDATDDPTVRNEAANLLRRSRDPHVAENLHKSLNNPNETALFRAYSVQHLFEISRKADPATKENIVNTLLEKLNDKERMVKREAFQALVRLKHPKAVELVKNQMNNEAGEEYRDLLIRAARSLEIPEVIPQIRPYLKSDHGPVVLAAVTTLGAFKDQGCTDDLLRAANNPRLKEYIHEAAMTAYYKIKKENE